MVAAVAMDNKGSMLFVAYGDGLLEVGRHFFTIESDRHPRCSYVVTHCGDKRFSRLAVEQMENFMSVVKGGPWPRNKSGKPCILSPCPVTVPG